MSENSVGLLKKLRVLIIVLLAMSVSQLILWGDVLSFSWPSIVGMTMNLAILILALILLKKFNPFSWAIYNLAGIKYLYMNGFGLYLFFFTDSQVSSPISSVDPIVFSIIQLLIWSVILISVVYVNLPKIRNNFSVQLWLQLICLFVIGIIMNFMTYW